VTDIGAVIYAPENAKMKINQGDIVMKVKVRALMKAKEKTWREAHSMDRLRELLEYGDTWWMDENMNGNR